jgi:gluconolactonase
MKRLLSILLLTTTSLSTVLAANFEVRDEPAFHAIVSPAARLVTNATGFKFTEGPAWINADGGYLIFSDIPADELKKWSAKDGTSVFRKPSRNTNGNLVDPKGHLVSCEHSGRRVVRAESDGSLTTLADKFEGRRFNSPNDVAIRRDGSVYFTDPDYGLGNQPRELEGCYVFRLDPATGKLAALVKDFDKPNGIAFSPDEEHLYVADSGKPRHIRVFEVQADGTVANGRVFCQIDKGGPDGIRVDAQGRLFSSAGDGVQIFDVSGKLIGKILVPESPANLCFGGKEGKTLFITARTGLYSIELLTAGR